MEEGVLERVGRTEMPSRGREGCECPGKPQGVGKDFLQLGPTLSSAGLRRESNRKGPPIPPPPPARASAPAPLYL